MFLYGSILRASQLKTINFSLMNTNKTYLSKNNWHFIYEENLNKYVQNLLIFYFCI